MNHVSTRDGARKWLAGAGLLVAFALGIFGLTAPSAPTSAGAAAPPSIQAQAATQQKQPQQPNKPVRRESGPPTDSGVAPRTGPASPLRPLDIPSFGANVRANTDTQSPNLAQQEPSIAVNPLNPLNVVAAAKDERAGTNTKQIWIYTSTDGGSTWINQQFPLIAPASSFSSDPVVKFSDDGTCYVTALPYGGQANDGIQVSRSTDGGITFLPAAHLPGTNSGSDKEWMWVDNSSSSPFHHRLYVAWMNFSPGFKVDYSTDQGQTWATSSIAPPADQFPMPITYPDGVAQVIYANNGNSFSYIRSTDGGVTWPGPLSGLISNYIDANCPPDNAGCGIWRLNSIPVIAVNPLNGNAVTVWADGSGGTATIRYSTGIGDGSNWTASQILAPPGIPNTYQVEPWVEADENGTFHAIWYDDRLNPNTSVFNIYYSQSTDDGATWSTAVRISTATSDLRIGIPSSYARAAGDYINVTASHGNVYGVWTDTRSGTGEDVYVVRGTFGGTPTPTVTGTTPTATSVATSGATSVATTIPSSTATSAAGTVTRTGSPVTTSTRTSTPGSPTPTATSTACTISFTDVPETNPFYAFIRCLACRGIVNGYADGTFRPFNNVTRGQLDKILSNAAGYYETIPPNEQTFTDVSPAFNAFWLYIERVYEHGAISGYPGDGVTVNPCTGLVEQTGLLYFRWCNNATRGQIAKIDAETAGYNETIPLSQRTFQDVPNINPFWVYIERISLHGVIAGYPGDGVTVNPCTGTVEQVGLLYFRWCTNATRGQTAKIVANTFFPGCETPRR